MGAENNTGGALKLFWKIKRGKILKKIYGISENIDRNERNTIDCRAFHIRSEKETPNKSKIIVKFREKNENLKIILKKNSNLPQTQQTQLMLMKNALHFQLEAEATRASNTAPASEACQIER